MDTVVLAEKLGRTWQAVANIRWRMGHTERKQGDFDLRPSGWYGETVGTLLLAYPDAYSTWKHYHRYTEVKVIGEDTAGWTSLLCYRDAASP